MLTNREKLWIKNYHKPNSLRLTEYFTPLKARKIGTGPTEFGLRNYNAFFAIYKVFGHAEGGNLSVYNFKFERISKINQQTSK